MRSVNTRGGKIADLVGRIDFMLDGYQQDENPPNTRNLIAFRDEGMAYALNLATFVHLGESPPPAVEGMTRDWLARERKLYLDARDPETAFMGMLGGAFSAQGLSESDMDEDLAHRISQGDFDLFAALVPKPDNAAAFDALAEVGVSSGLIETPAPYDPAFRI